MSTNTDIVTLKCFHTCESLNQFYIRTCELKKCTDGKYYHVIYLREPVEKTQLHQISSITCHHTATNRIDEIWEELSTLPLGSLYNLTPACSSVLIKNIITQLIISLCEQVCTEHVYRLLFTTNKSTARSFIQNIGAIAESTSGDVEEGFRYLHLNRFNLHCVSRYNNKQKVRVMRNQLLNILDIIRCFLMTKIVKVTKDYTCHNCKLVGYCPRFLDMDVCELHTIYCSSHTQKLARLMVVGQVYPNTKHAILNAIAKVESLEVR
ncbi:hypothetical protein CcNV_103 [Crangon crangon nudivirus]|uniref:Uncharacterized protein n=1 Tax=Crangon crangon nudivirus TaxID=2880838 RepID=A0AAE9BZA3_9VIRU|nr:hypothetical protein QKT25_gp104 [Crangon crangon nudivirus]UBZ25588.1 hypothetical protein CcNV_103 [Crangon crangon nudivirus]